MLLLLSFCWQGLLRKLLIVWMVCLLPLYVCLHYHLWQEAGPKYKPLLGQTRICLTFHALVLISFLIACPVCTSRPSQQNGQVQGKVFAELTDLLFGAILVYGLRPNLNLIAVGPIYTYWSLTLRKFLILRSGNFPSHVHVHHFPWDSVGVIRG